MKKVLKWFTLVEVIIALIIISIGILGVYQWVWAGRRDVDSTQSKIIAVNLAREWMEMIYNIRDTNVLRWSSQKNECWLKRMPFTWNDQWSSSNNECKDDFSLSYYARSNTVTWDVWISYYNPQIAVNSTTRTSIIQPDKWFAVYAIWTDRVLNLTDWIDDWDLAYALCYENNRWFSCPLNSGNTTSTPENFKKFNTKYWNFFRSLQIKWLYNKETGTKILNCTPPNTSNPECNNESAKELVFCSRVEYKKWSYWKEELCWSITNWQ